MRSENGRKLKVRSTIALLAFLLCISVPAASWAMDIYLRIDGIPGDVTISPQLGSGWIKINGWNWGVSMSAMPGATATGAGSGRANLSGITITMPFHQVSPVLFQYAATGRMIRSATLVIPQTGAQPQPIVRITLEGVYVSSYKSTGSSLGGAPGPVDELTLNAQRLKYECPAKGVTTGFDFSTLKAL